MARGQRHIRVKAIYRDEGVDTEMYALALWLQAKREVKAKRARQAADRAKRREDRP